MGNITTMAVFVWTLNILMFLMQAGINDIASGSQSTFYNSSGSVLDSYSTGGNLVVPNSDIVGGELNPESSTPVSETSGFGFLDSIGTVKNWVQSKLNYLGSIVLAPYNILNSIPGLPKAFVGAISLLWYGVSILLLLMLIFGRTD